MALKREIEAEIAKIKEPDKQKMAREFYEALPQFQEPFLADADYQRNIQKTKADQAEALASKTKNQEWWKSAEGEMNNLTAENADLKTKLAALEIKRDDAGTDLSAAGQQKFDKEITLLKTQLDASTKALDAVKSNVVDKDFYQKDVTSRADSFGNMILDIAEACYVKHVKEFGEALSKDEFLKYMNDNKIAGVAEAYEKMTADKRQEQWKTKTTEEIRKDLESKIKLPLDTGSGFPTPDGPLKLFINKTTPTQDIPADGSGRLAAAAAAEMRSEGKG